MVEVYDLHFSDAAAALATVDWGAAGKVHDWRNHVPEHVQDMWETFSSQQKLALYKWAQDAASAEEWE